VAECANAVDGDNEGETWYRVFLLGVRGSEDSTEELISTTKAFVVLRSITLKRSTFPFLI